MRRRHAPYLVLVASVLLGVAPSQGCSGNPFQGKGELPSAASGALDGPQTVVLLGGQGYSVPPPEPERWAYLRTGTHVAGLGEDHNGRRLWVAPLAADMRQVALLDRSRGLVLIDLSSRRLAIVARYSLSADPLDLVYSGRRLYLVTQGRGSSYSVTILDPSGGKLKPLSSTRHDGYYAGLWATLGSDHRERVYLVDNAVATRPQQPKCAWPGALTVHAGVVEGERVRWEPGLKLPGRYLSVARRGPFLIASNALGSEPNLTLFGTGAAHFVDLRPHLQHSLSPVQTPSPADLMLYAATYAEGTLWLAGAKTKPGGARFELRSFGSDRATRCDILLKSNEKRFAGWTIEGPVDIMVEGNLARVQHRFLTQSDQSVSILDLATCKEDVGAHGGERQWLLEGAGVLLRDATATDNLSLVTSPTSSRPFVLPADPIEVEAVPVLGTHPPAIHMLAMGDGPDGRLRHYLLPPHGTPWRVQGTPLVATREGRALVLTERGLQLVRPGGQVVDTRVDWAIDKAGALLGDRTMRLRYEGFGERPDRPSERAFLPAAAARADPVRLQINGTGGEYVRVGNLIVHVDRGAEPCRIDVHDLTHPGAKPTTVRSDVACQTRFAREGHGAGPAVELYSAGHALVFSQPEGRFAKRAPYEYEQLSRELVNYVLDLSDPSSLRFHGPYRTREGEFIEQTFAQGETLYMVARRPAGAGAHTRYLRGVDLSVPGQPRALAPRPVPGRLVAHTSEAVFALHSSASNVPASVLTRTPLSGSIAVVARDVKDRHVADVTLVDRHLLVTHYPRPGENPWKKRPATLAVLESETLQLLGVHTFSGPARVLAAADGLALVAAEDACSGIRHLLVDLKTPSAPRELGELRSFKLLDTQGDEVLLLRGGELERMRVADLHKLLVPEMP